MFKSSLILFNITKNRNLGGLVRTADALGVSEIIVIGKKGLKRYGHCGTFDSSKQKHFYTFDDAVIYLQKLNYNIVGIEINNESIPVENHPFQGNTAFLPGNEGNGLSDKQKKLCNKLVYISQYGSGASLNVNVATGIVLHHFAVWANFKSNNIEAQKFVKSRILESVL
jgi:tRNA G18 (ribose-2'-O)-methylase SpoU